ncbi:hypothetical protein [Amycolatopsis palatopharyngis]|uniref:hypothetical protein n=1 Tax=Amycolatopsis palatopharyngis TaxID=187982 RepID=UPI000E220A62|nr:hypothetical protein [Amycolatopsis palatopharyngis]
MNRRALDETYVPEPLPSPVSSTAPTPAPSNDAVSERAVLYEQVLDGLYRLNTDQPRRTVAEFHDWFTPTVPSDQGASADEVLRPEPEAGDAQC